MGGDQWWTKIRNRRMSESDITPTTCRLASTMTNRCTLGWKGRGEGRGEELVQMRQHAYTTHTRKGWGCSKGGVGLIRQGGVGLVREGGVGFVREGGVGFVREGGVGPVRQGRVGFVREGGVGLVREGGVQL